MPKLSPGTILYYKKENRYLKIKDIRSSCYTRKGHNLVYQMVACSKTGKEYKKQDAWFTDYIDDVTTKDDFWSIIQTDSPEIHAQEPKPSTFIIRDIVNIKKQIAFLQKNLVQKEIKLFNQLNEERNIK